MQRYQPAYDQGRSEVGRTARDCKAPAHPADARHAGRWSSPATSQRPRGRAPAGGRQGRPAVILAHALDRTHLLPSLLLVILLRWGAAALRPRTSPCRRAGTRVGVGRRVGDWGGRRGKDPAAAWSSSSLPALPASARQVDHVHRGARVKERGAHHQPHALRDDCAPTTAPANSPARWRPSWSSRCWC